MASQTLESFPGLDWFSCDSCFFPNSCKNWALQRYSLIQRNVAWSSIEMNDLKLLVCVASDSCQVLLSFSQKFRISQSAWVYRGTRGYLGTVVWEPWVWPTIFIKEGFIALIKMEIVTDFSKQTLLIYTFTKSGLSLGEGRLDNMLDRVLFSVLSLYCQCNLFPLSCPLTL